MMKKYNTGKQIWTYGDEITIEYNITKKKLGPCPRCGTMTSEYGGGFSCHKDYCPNSAGSFTCRTADKWPDWWNTEIDVCLDGNSWCAVGKDFINLQESDSGFGDTPDEAVADLLADKEAK